MIIVFSSLIFYQYQPTVLAADEPDEERETLENENEPDHLLNEQTWPTAEELENGMSLS